MEVLAVRGKRKSSILCNLFSLCSLAGLLQGNGPFLWQRGTAQPVPNPYAWNTLANVVWIEQPVSTLR